MLRLYGTLLPIFMRRNKLRLYPSLSPAYGVTVSVTVVCAVVVPLVAVTVIG